MTSFAPNTRREFIKSTAAASFGFAGLHILLENTTVAQITARDPIGFGPLRPDPRRLLDLPAGFTYRVISTVGGVMDDGLFIPGEPDGMCAFPAPDGLTVLVRNHELHPGRTDVGPFGTQNERFDTLNRRYIYDPGNEFAHCQGGTTTLLYDTRTGRVLREYLSLAGTINNCAGGPTPWNSWITCEETEWLAGNTMIRNHGYAFEVPAVADGRLAQPVPLEEMGRFRREAVAIDPRTGIVYQTEDQNDGLIYRYIPNTPGYLAAGGRLQMLAILDHPRRDTRNWDVYHEPGDIQPIIDVGTVLPVRWIDAHDVRAPNSDLRIRGYQSGAAKFARAEGMWFGQNTVYFACTSGGIIQTGQIWKYTPSPHEGTPREIDDPGKLELFVEPNDRGLIDNADNLTIAPWGDLIVCEDGNDDQYLVGITPDGRFYKFARNAADGTEFAGATFSPDGTTLFVNMQSLGRTLAITGPWRKHNA